MKQNRGLNMGKSQDKLKEELRQLCDEEKYYEAARLLVLIEDTEDIDFLVERLALDWLWNLKDGDDETWSYAFFLDGFCNEFGAYGWRDSNMPLAVYNYRRSYELGNRYAAVRLAACYEKGVPDNAEKEKWLLKAAEGGLPQAQCELGVHYFDMAKGEEASIAEPQLPHFRSLRHFSRCSIMSFLCGESLDATFSSHITVSFRLKMLSSAILGYSNLK